MANIPDTRLGRMYREHIELLRTKQLERLLSEQYASNALLISSIAKVPRYHRGLAQIREHMSGILGIEDLQSDVIFWAETNDPETLMVTEQIAFTRGGQRSNMRFADSWVLEGGKIAIHFAGMVQYADGSLA
jgi:hypothetical protein